MDGRDLFYRLRHLSASCKHLLKDWIRSFADQANCSACHGAELDGKGPAGAALQPAPASFKDPKFWETRDEKAVKAGIKNGKPGTAMMAFAHLPDEDVEAIVAYLVANKP